MNSESRDYGIPYEIIQEEKDTNVKRKYWGQAIQSGNREFTVHIL